MTYYKLDGEPFQKDGEEYYPKLAIAPYPYLEKDKLIFTNSEKFYNDRGYYQIVTKIIEKPNFECYYKFNPNKNYIEQYVEYI